MSIEDENGFSKWNLFVGICLSRCTNSTVLARPKSLLIHDMVFAYSSVETGHW
jgi:hypothetical protein